MQKGFKYSEYDLKIEKQRVMRRRVLSLLMVLALFVTTLYSDWGYVSGEYDTSVVKAEDENPPLYLKLEGEYQSLVMSDVSLTESGGKYTFNTAPQTVTYGDTLDLSLNDSSYDGTITYYYASVASGTVSSSNEMEKENGSIIANMVPGDYFIFYSFSGQKGETESEFEYSSTSAGTALALRVEKATLESVSYEEEGVKWTDGSTADWKKVEQATNGYDLSNESSSVITGYTVELLQDSTVKKTVTVSGAANHTYDFTSVMLELGAGTYLVDVKPILSSAYADYYNAITDSDKGTSGNTYVVNVTIAKDSGIESASFKDGSSSALMISNNATYGTKELVATAKENRALDYFSNSTTGFDIETEGSSYKVNFVVETSYSGENDVTITAISKDVKAPEISAYTIGTGDDEGKLLATASDSETGIYAYAFSTESSKDKVSNWISVENPQAGSSDFAYTPTASGIYYFYIKDVSGNITQSETSYKVTKVTYYDYYADSSKVDKSELIFGDAEYTIVQPDRKGYEFLGYYNNSEFTGEAWGEELASSDLGTDVNLYAKWSRESIKFSDSDTRTVTKTYDGISTSVKATVSNRGTLTYQWQKKKVDEEAEGGFSWEDVSGATSNTLTVGSVKDSGTYRVYVKETVSELVNGEETTSVAEGYSEDYIITINPVELTVKIADKTVSYGTAVESSEYDYTITGFINSDSEESAAGFKDGAISSAYSQWDNAGTYSITGSGYEADNYSFKYVSATLTVTKKDISKTTSGMTVKLYENDVEVTDGTYIYDGTEKKPTVEFYDSKKGETGTLIDADQYSLNYRDYVNAGNASVVITMSEDNPNYTGTFVGKYKINKAEVEAAITLDDTNWTYGDDNRVPATTVKIKDTETEITDIKSITWKYTKVKDGNETACDGTPTDAGSYKVYGIVYTDNYAPATTNTLSFTIQPRNIKIISASASWTYDGNEHSDTSYTIEAYDNADPQNKTGDSLIGTDSFKSISIEASITEVGTKTNEIKYEFSSSTNSDNYKITKAEGTLTVTENKLSVPSGYGWYSDGYAHWVAVTKTGLSVEYKLKLYRVINGASVQIKYDSDSKTVSEVSADEIAADQDAGVFTTTSSMYNFHDVIKTDLYKNYGTSITSADAIPYYYFIVQAVPVYSDDEVENYKKSDYSEASEYKYIGLFSTVEKASRTNQGLGLESAYFIEKDYGQENYATSKKAFIIAGEDLRLGCVVKSGYELAETPWTSSEAVGGFYPSVYTSTVVNGDGTKKNYYYATFYTGSTQNGIASVYCNVSDKLPDIESYSVASSEDNKSVTFTFTVSDEISLGNWGILKGTVDETGKVTIDTSKGSGWQTINESDVTSKNGKKTYSGTYTINSTDTDPAGKYYLCVHDGVGGTYVYCTTSYEIYKITFDKGDTNDEANEGKSIDPILKIENQTVTLPANVFTKEGYGFKNWQSTEGGLYEDAGSYASNKSADLTAQWTDEEYEYTVKYYLMDTDGVYNDGTNDTTDTPSKTETFTAKYGTKVTSADSILALDNTGMQLDTAKTDSFTMKGTGNVLKIYYKRNLHTITYKYKKSSAGTYETLCTVSFYYGAAVSETSVEEAISSGDFAGYTSGGWTYSSTGSKPDTMPDEDLEATATYTPNATTYTIKCYTENLDESGYTLASSYTDERATEHGSKITFDVTDSSLIPEVEGFTARGIVVTTGSDSPDVNDMSASKEVTMSAIDGEHSYISVYYKRNSYTLSLNVWKGDRKSDGERFYTKDWTFKYQETFTASDYTSYGQGDDWNNAWAANFPDESMSGYVLATYVDWSTDSAPASMPAGDVTISREWVKDTEVDYTLTVYVETATDGKYEKKGDLVFTAPKGSTVTFGLANTEETKYSITDSTVAKTIPYHDYYEFDTDNANNVTSATVKADGSTNLVVYYDRKYITTTIKYYYKQLVTDDEGKETQKSILMATVNKKCKWEHSYDFEPEAMFDGNVTTSTADGKITSTADKYTYDSDSGNWTTSSQNIWTDATSVTLSDNYAAIKSIHMRSSKYVISYDGYYVLNGGGNYAQEQYISYGCTGDSDYGGTDDLQNGTRTRLMGQYSNSVNVYYSEVNTNKTYYNDMIYYVRDDNFKFDLDTENTDYYLNSNNKKRYYITTTLNDQKYFCRIINAKQVYEPTYDAKNSYAQYPGASELLINKTISHDTDNLKEGYEYIYLDSSGEYSATETSYKYVVSTSADSNGRYYIYFIDNNDGMYYGNKNSYGYTFNPDSSTASDPLQKRIQSYFRTMRSTYQTTHYDNLETSDTNYDANGNAIRVYNNSASSVCMTGNGSYVVDFIYRDKYPLYYELNGNTINEGDYKTYLAGEYAPVGYTLPTDLKRDGYEVYWYKDSMYSELVGSTIYIGGTTRVYGKYQKATYTGHNYVYYQLPEDICDSTTDETSTTSYITADNLEKMKSIYNTEDSTRITSESTEGGEVAFTNGAGAADNYKPVTTKYYFDGELFMIDTTWKILAFNQVSFTSDSTYEGTTQTGNYATYAKTGFYYDKTNTNNRLYGYCQYSPVNMSAYYARYTYNLTEDNNTYKSRTEAAANFSKSIVRYGAKISLPGLARNGYAFTGYKYYTANSEENEFSSEWTDSASAVTKNENKSETFAMPDKDLYVQANYEPVELTGINIYHYYQTTDLTYDSSLLSDIASDSVSSESVKIWVDAAESEILDGTDTTGIEGSLYYTGSGDSKKLRAVKYTDASGVSKYYTASLSDVKTAEISGQSVTYVNVDTGNILLAVAPLSGLKTEETVSVNDKVLVPSNGVFAFDSVSYNDSENVSQLKADGSFAMAYGMTVEYYYTRTAGYTVRATSKATDGGTTTITIMGTGVCYYGQTVSIKASVSSGFEFVGWYKASDVLSGYDSESDSWDSCTLIDGYASKTPVSTDTSYTVTIKQKTLDLVAVLKPRDVVVPEISITGKNSYTYGYETATDNTLDIGVKLSETASDSDKSQYNYTKVESYQWYIEDAEGSTEINGTKYTEISGEKAATYVFATGKGLGTYTYICKVGLTRTDNGRTATAYSEPYTVTVGKNTRTVTAKNIEMTYWGYGPEYTFTVSGANSGYTTYFALDKELTKDNYSTSYDATSLSADTFKNLMDVKVKMDESGNAEVDSYTIYYYVADTTGNYEDSLGSFTVTIEPKTVTLQSTGSAASRTYDGTKDVDGAIDETGTFKHEIASGDFVTINGLVSKDSNTDTKFYWIDFDGQFNDSHVDTANMITLSNFSVSEVLKEDSTYTASPDYNYKFETGTTLSIPAQITPFEVEVTWNEDDVFTYNESSSEYEIYYDGTAHAPSSSVSLAEGTSFPSGEEVYLVSTGAQTNTGSYKAYANVACKIGGVDKGTTYTYTSDYKVNDASCDYKILKPTINVTPINTTATYDNETHSITAFYITTTDDSKTYAITNNTTGELQKDANSKVIASGEGITDTIKNRFNTWGSFEVATELDSSEASSKDKMGQAKVYPSTNAGTYTVKATSIVLKDTSGKDIIDNYNVVYNTGSLTINPAPITIKSIAAENKTFDGNTSATIVNKEADGSQKTKVDLEFEGTYTESPDLYVESKYITAAFADADVGVDKTVNLTVDYTAEERLEGSDSPNYTLVASFSRDGKTYKSQTTTTATIYSQSILVEPKDITVIYGQTAQISVGYYALNAKGKKVSTDEYAVNLDYFSGQLTYDIKTSAGISKGTYTTDNTNQTASLDINQSDTGFTAGQYKLTINANTLTSDNYNLTFATTSATITVLPRPITIETGSKAVTKTYDGNANITATDLKTNEDYYTLTKGLSTFSAALADGDSFAGLGLSYNTSNTVSKYASSDANEVGYDITKAETDNLVTLSGLTLSNSNYVLVVKDSYSLSESNQVTKTDQTSVDLHGEIIRKALTIKVSNKSITYGDAAPEYSAYEVTSSGLISGETLDSLKLTLDSYYTLSCDYVATVGDANSEAGSYDIAIAKKTTLGEGVNDNNYNITLTKGTLTVGKYKINVTANNISQTYGDAAPSFTVTYSDPSASSAMVSYVSTIEGFSDFDSYIAALVKASGDALVSAGKLTASSDGTYTSYAFKHSSSFKGKDLNNNGAGAAVSSISTKSEVDNYIITPSVTASLKNYDFVYKTGTLTINPYKFNVQLVSVADKTYDSTTAVADANITITIADLTADDVTYFKNTFSGKSDITWGSTTITKNGEEKTVDTMTMTYATAKVAGLTITSAYQKTGSEAAAKDVYLVDGVATAKNVNTTIGLDTSKYLGQRYSMKTATDGNDQTAQSATSTINKAELKVKAYVGSDTEGASSYHSVIYGDNPVIYFSYTGVQTNDKLSSQQYGYAYTSSNNTVYTIASIYDGTTSDKNGIQYDYTPNTDEEGDYSTITNESDTKGNDGETYINYRVTPVFSKDSTTYVTSNNYYFTAVSTNFNVKTKTLTKVTPTWLTTETDNGTVKWTDAAKVGAVTVDHYVAVLYKDGVAAALTSDQYESLPSSFTSKTGYTELTKQDDSYPVSFTVAEANPEVSTDEYTIDMSEYMRILGQGTYTVGVVAWPSTTNNKNYINVCKSDEGKTGNFYASKINVSFGADETTQQAISAEGVSYKNTLYKNTSTELSTAVNSATASYVMLQGETGISLETELDHTSYYISDYTITAGTTTKTGASASSHSLDVSGIMKLVSDDEVATTEVIEEVSTITKVTQDADITLYATSQSSIYVKVNLKKRPVTFASTITKTNGDVFFGYEDAPEFTLNPSAADGDINSGYTYTYKWVWRRGTLGSYSDTVKKNGVSYTLTNNTSQTVSLPTGVPAYKNNEYDLACTVTATRIDNGESATYEYSKESSYSGVKLTSYCTILPASVKDAKIVYKDTDDSKKDLNASGWKYGESRKTPLVSINPDNGTVHFYYRTYDTEYGEDGVHNAITSGDNANTEYSKVNDWAELSGTSVPTNVGKYQVYAKVDAVTDGDYETYCTAVATYEISQNKLSSPENLKLDKSETSPYGLASWDAVAGPKENNGAEGDSASSVTVTYDVSLYYYNTASNYAGSYKTKETANCLKTATGVTENKYDFSSYITENGTYFFKVQAKSDNTTNCADSDWVEQGEALALNIDSDIKAVTKFADSVAVGETASEITLSDDPTTYYDSATGYTKTYDGQAFTLSVILSTSLNDLKNTEGNTISYQWYLNGNLDNNATGESVSFTNAGTYAYSCAITVSGGTNLTTYTPTYKVTINKRKVTLTAAAASSVYGEAFGSSTAALTVTSGAKANCGSSDLDYKFILVDDEDLGAATTYMTKDENGVYTYPTKLVISNNDGTEETPATTRAAFTNLDGAGTYNDVIVPDYDSTKESAANYDITLEKADYEITKRPITIISRDAEKTYDGTAFSMSGLTSTVTKEDGETETIDNIYLTKADPADENVTTLAYSDAISAVSFTGTITDYVDSPSANNTYNNDSVKISRTVEENGTSKTYDMTASYDITYKYGTLKINKRHVTVKARTVSKVYDGTELKLDGVTSTTQNESGEDITLANIFETEDASGNTVMLASNEAFSAVTFTGTITNVGSTDNTFDGSSIKISRTTGEGDEKVVTDVTSNYEISIASSNGTLTVTKASDTVNFTYSGKVYDGKAAETPTGVAATNAKNTTVPTFKFYEKSINEGMPVYTELMQAPRNVGTYAIKAFVAGSDNFNACESEYKDFNITKRSITITSRNVAKVYDGTALTLESQGLRTGDTDNIILTKPDGSETVSTLGEGDAISQVNFTGTITEKGTADNTYDSIKITYTTGEGDAKETQDVTSNYEITCKYGTLKIYKVTGYEGYYDGEAHGITLEKASESDDATITYNDGNDNSIENSFKNAFVESSLTYATTDGITKSVEITIPNREGTIERTVTGVKYTVNYSISSTGFTDISGNAAVTGASTVTIYKEPVVFEGLDSGSTYQEEIKTVYSKLVYGTNYNAELGTPDANGLYPAVTSYTFIDDKGTEDTSDDTSETRALQKTDPTKKYKDAIVPTPVIADATKDNYDITYIKGTYSLSDKVISVTETNPVYTYDGQAHQGSVTVDQDTYDETVSEPVAGKDSYVDSTSVGGTAVSPTSAKYTIYYDTVNELTVSSLDAEKAANNATTTMPSFTDVGTYTVYYYVDVDNDDYNTVQDSITVTINRGDKVLTPVTDGLTGSWDESSKTLTLTYDAAKHYINASTTVNYPKDEDKVITYSYQKIKDADGNDITPVAVTDAVSADGKTNVGVTDAGTYQITASSAAGPNTNAATDLVMTLVIEPEEVSLTANAQSSDYMSAIKETSCSISVTKGGVTADKVKEVLGVSTKLEYTFDQSTLDTSDDVTRTLYSDATNGYDNAGTYTDAIIPTYTSNDNYKVTIVKAAYTINKIDLPKNGSEETLTGYKAASYEGIYDGNSHGISVQVADTISGSGTGNKAEIYYSASPFEGTGSTPIATQITNGTASTSENNAFSDVNIVNGSVTARTVYYCILSTNYKDVCGSKTVLIKKRSVTLTAQTANSEYNEAIASVTATASETVTTPGHEAGIVGSDLGTIGATVDSTKVYVGASVGEYEDAITPTYSDTSKAYNYDITLVKATYSIVKAKNNAVIGKVHAASVEKVYDKTAYGITVTVDSDLEDAKVYYSTQDGLEETTIATTASLDNICYTDVKLDNEGNVIPYIVYYYVTSKNYKMITGSATVKITKAAQAISIVESDNTWPTGYSWDASNLKLTFSYAGSDNKIVARTNGEGSLVYTGNSFKNKGTYTVKINAPATRNYEAASEVEVTVEINQATKDEVTDTITDNIDNIGGTDGNAKKQYDGDSIGLESQDVDNFDGELTYEYILLDENDNPTDTVTYEEPTSVGKYQVKVSGTANSETGNSVDIPETSVGTITITPAPAEIKVQPTVTTYDTKNHEAEVSVAAQQTTLGIGSADVTNETTIYYRSQPFTSDDDAKTFLADCKNMTNDYLKQYYTHPQFSEVGTHEVYYVVECDTNNYYFDKSSGPILLGASASSGTKISGYKYISYGSTYVTINPIPVTLTWSATSFQYDSTAKTVTATVTNACTGDEVYVETYTDNTKTEAGNYTATATKLGGANASNYTLEGATGVTQDWTIVAQSEGQIDIKDIIDALGVTPEEAAEIAELAEKYDVSLDTLKITDEVLKNRDIDTDIKGSCFGRLKARIVNCKKHGLTIKWSKQTGADGYMVYGNYCNQNGKKYKLEYICSTGKNTTTKVMKNLKKARYYKYIVRAYKLVNGKKITIAASVTIHGTTLGGKYGVAKAVKLKKVGKQTKNLTKVTLKVGKSAKVKAKEIRQVANKKIKHHRNICYESSDETIATVNKKGKIVAKSKGKCKIWVYAQNGVYKTINVTVK